MPRVSPVVLTTLVVAGFAALALFAPHTAAAWLAKEGPVEHASHAILLLAALAWSRLAIRTRDCARLLAVALAAFLLLVLAEELDWGAVYGWTGPGPTIATRLGHRNLHNAARGASYLLFAIPLAAYFTISTVPLPPTRRARHTFILLAVLFVACNLTSWEREAQELLEALLYTLMLTVAIRAPR